MNWRFIGTISCLCFVLLAHGSSDEVGRSPEREKLGYFVGKWKREFQAKPGPFSPGGRFVQTEFNEWISGRGFVISHWTVRSESSSSNGLTLLGYDGTEHGYTYDSFSASGRAEHGRGTLEAGEWTWSGQHILADKLVRVRFTIKPLSSASYTFFFDTEAEDGRWVRTAEGNAKRIDND